MADINVDVDMTVDMSHKQEGRERQLTKHNRTRRVKTAAAADGLRNPIRQQP